MASWATFGNDLFTGKRSVNFVGRRRIWFTIAIALIIVMAGITAVRGGFVLGIEFRGGSQFQIQNVQVDDTSIAEDAVVGVVPDAHPVVTTLGRSGISVQTDQLTNTLSNRVTDALASAYDVKATQVTSSFIGPSWGADISRKAIQALVVFVILVALVMAIYFRTWKMAAAAMIALGHDLVITALVYGVTGVEITPAAVIGFLTILGYSLYDSVVVFDKIRENTRDEGGRGVRTFGEAVNFAVNQTLIRSINTSIVAALPVASILFIGSFVLGAGTLQDISLALLIGMIAGTYSTIFIAAPLYALLREKEPKVIERDQRARRQRESAARPSENATDAELPA